MIACLASGLLVIALALPDRFTSAGFSDPSAQSARASALLTRSLGHDPEPGLVVLAHAVSPVGFAAPSARAAVAGLAARAAADPAVGATEQPFGRRPVTSLLSHDHRTAIVLVYFRRAGIDAAAAPIDRLRSRLRDPRLTVAFGGYPLVFLDGNSVARSDLVRAELIAFPFLALLMIAIFRGVTAAAIPLAVGAVTVAITFAVLRLLATVIGISIFALDLAALLGLGLAVDYSLLLVSRYREEAVADLGRAAITRAVRATAGRAVILSGAAVAGACAALLVFPEEFINSMGIAGILVALLAAASALALTPPLLLLAGSRVLRRPGARHDEADPGSDRWERWAGWVMRHRFDVALAAVLALIAAAAPALRLAPTLADASALPTSFQSRQVADTIDATFVPHLLYPVDIAIRTSGANSPPASARATALPAGLLAISLQRTGDAQVVAVTPGRFGTTLVQAVLRLPPYAARSQALIRGVRALPSRPLVGGNTAEFVDLKHSIAARAPWAILIAAVATVLVLLLVTGSVVLAAKSLVLDLLGLSAALGLLVLVFQHRALGLAGVLGSARPVGDRDDIGGGDRRLRLRAHHRLLGAAAGADRRGAQGRCRGPRGGRHRRGPNRAGHHERCASAGGRAARSHLLTPVPDQAAHRRPGSRRARRCHGRATAARAGVHGDLRRCQLVDASDRPRCVKPSCTRPAPVIK